MSKARVSVEELSCGQLDEVEPLWNSLREHHGSVAPAWLGPPRERGDSWARRRRDYQTWLSSVPASFVLVARRRGRVIAYAMVHLRAGSATFPLSERAGEIETFCVLPEERGSGVGTLLLDAVRERLRALGAAEIGLSVLEGNDAALRFYRRAGLRQYAVWLSGPVDTSGQEGSP
jgi:ribosomal protein S18 acetylase RimI-like enzyme